MIEHPPFSDFERFVSGGAPESADFESHVSHCDACAAALAREAHIELVTCAAASDLRSRREWLSRLRGPGYVMGAALALAASVLLLFATAHRAAAATQPSLDDVHGQPLAVFPTDGGYDGPFLAVRDAGPVRACAGCAPRGW